MLDSTRKLTVKMPWSQELTHAEVTELYVRPGDTVDIDAPVLGLSTSAGPQIVHAAHRGRVVPLVATGDQVDKGEPLYVIRVQEPASSRGGAANRFGSDSGPVAEPAQQQADWLDLYDSLRGWAWFMLACGIYVLAARFLIPYLPYWFPDNTPGDWLTLALVLSFGGAGVFTAISFRGNVLARRFTLGLAVCWGFVTIAGIEVKTGFSSALVAPRATQDQLVLHERTVTEQEQVPSHPVDPADQPKAKAPAEHGSPILAEVHPPHRVTPPPERTGAPDTASVPVGDALAIPTVPQSPSAAAEVAISAAPAPAASPSGADQVLRIPSPVPRPKPIAHASMAAFAPEPAEAALAAPTLVAYAAPTLATSPGAAQKPSPPRIAQIEPPARPSIDPSGIGLVKAHLALPGAPEQAALPPRRAVMADPATTPGAAAQDAPPTGPAPGARPPEPDGPVGLAALSDRVAPLPWIRPRYTRLSLLFQHLEDPRDPASPEIGSPYAADLPPEVALAVTSQKVAALRPVLQVTGWCIAAHDQSGLKRISTDPELYHRFAVSDRMQLVLVELTIESDTLAMLADALPVFGDGDPGFFHNRRPVMGGFSGAELLELGEDWLSARSNQRMDPNYPDLETGGTFYFETEQLLAALETQGCADPVWQGGAPSTPLGAALDAALSQ